MKLKYTTDMAGAGYDNKFCQTVQLHDDAAEAETQVINLYPELTYEVFEGFGGAVTESVAYVYSLMNEEQKKQVVETYFSRDAMNYRFVRVPMDSCDFSLDTYEAVSDPGDFEFQNFQFERMEKYILPMLADIRKTAGDGLKLMLTPWSPPAFMKTNGSRTKGGRLKPQYRQMWAEYICRYIQELKNRGYHVHRISIQNEPKAAQSWDSCLFSTQEEKVFLRDFLYPAMKVCGHDDVGVFIWDHNKERIYERVRDVIDDSTRHMVAGAAFHWYSGDHFEAMELVRRHYPDVKMIMSESCLEYRLFDEKNIENMTYKLCHEIIGDMNHGMCAFYDWNLLLDEKGGPNYAGNYCHAPFLYNTKTKELLPQKIQRQYYYFAHNITPGSVRIAYTKYTEQIDVAAYLTPANTIAVILLNKSGALLPVTFRIQGKAAEVFLQGKALAACMIEL